jgi:hypothetical protein
MCNISRAMMMVVFMMLLLLLPPPPLMALSWSAVNFTSENLRSKHLIPTA